MIVEPVATTPRSPLRRLAGTIAMAVPVVLLAGVIAGGVLGPRSEVEAGRVGPGTSPRAADAAAGLAADAPAPMADTGRPPGDRTAERAVFPAAVAGLRVRGVADVVDHRPGIPEGRIIAVAGYLSVETIAPECADRVLGTTGPFCSRSGILADRRDSPFTYPAVGVGGIGPHLHVFVPVGIRMPYQVARTTRMQLGAPLPVVAVGRFEQPPDGTCTPVTRGCEDVLVVERVLWSEGEPYERPTSIDPALDIRFADDAWQLRGSAAVAAIGPSVATLVAAYVAAGTLQRVDPDAAAALAARLEGAGGPGPPAALWYVRALDSAWDPARYPSGDAPPRVVWAIVDDATGDVLLRGIGPHAGP